MNYSQYILESISFIQHHLSDDLTIHKVAEKIGYSDYHFHRIFKQEVGLSLYDYIRQQRLTKSAMLLKNTNLSILEISLQCQFQSQEAFSRSFKKQYQLTPKKFRQVNQLIMSKGELTMENNSKIKGWIKSGNAADKYEINLDTKESHLSQRSAHLFLITDDLVEEEFRTIMQQFKAKNYIGQRVKFSAFVKTKLTKGQCGLWMRVDSKYYDMLAFDNMKDRMITSTTDWNFYSCVLDIPENSDVINIGILLLGEGDVWIDSCQFKKVPLSEPVTEITPSQFVPDSPEHLDFT